MSSLCVGSTLTLGMARNSRSPAIASEDGVAAIDRDHLPGHPRGLVGCEEEDAVGNVLRGAETPRRDRLHEPRLSVRPVRLELRDRRGIREDETGSDRVDGDAETSELV